MKKKKTLVITPKKKPTLVLIKVKAAPKRRVSPKKYA